MLQAEFDLLIRTLGLLDSLVDDELGERLSHLSLDLSEVFLGEVQIDRLFGDRVKQTKEAESEVIEFRHDFG